MLHLGSGAEGASWKGCSRQGGQGREEGRWVPAPALPAPALPARHSCWLQWPTVLALQAASTAPSAPETSLCAPLSNTASAASALGACHPPLPTCPFQSCGGSDWSGRSPRSSVSFTSRHPAPCGRRQAPSCAALETGASSSRPDRPHPWRNACKESRCYRRPHPQLAAPTPVQGLPCCPSAGPRLARSPDSCGCGVQCLGQ